MKRLVTLLLCVFLFQPVMGKEKTTISPWLFKKLSKAEQLIAKKSYQQAEQSLKAILKQVDNKSYEQATVLRSLSSVYALKEQYRQATETLVKAVNLQLLPKAQQQQAILNLGQLYMAIEQYRKAIATLEPWLAKNSSSDAQINVLIANAYAQLKQYSKALPFIKKAIAQTKKPDESWYQLNLALYYELENYSAAAQILKKLIAIYPDKKTYWQQLSSTYQQSKQFKKAASIQYLAYKKGLINSEKEISQLADLFLYIGAPYKAANLLQQGLTQKRIKSTSKNWESLANAWRMAKEFKKAITALETASKMNEKGRLYQQLGQIHVQQEQWNKAISALKKAIAKGGLKDTGNSYFLLGMSYYELKNIEQAKKYFLAASKYSKNKKAALQWLKYIS